MRSKKKKKTSNILLKVKKILSLTSLSINKKTFYSSDSHFFLFFLASTCFLISLFLIVVFPKSVRKVSHGEVLSLQMDYKRIPLKDRVFVLKPVLKNGVFSFPILSAQSVIGLDLDTNVTLYEKNPDLPVLPASITKLVTAMVALESFDKNALFSFNGEYIDGQKMGLLKGERMKVIDLINALLVYSANDAAYLLAENYPGGVEAFVQAMNEKAASLGALNTHFENPTGFDGQNHKTTASDLMLISKAAIDNPDILDIVKKKEIDLVSSDGKIRHNLKNTNKLLGILDGVVGLKTGWTENARENLVTYFVKDNHHLLIVLLGSQDRFGETKELIDWIFSSYDWLWVEAK
ncbi:MAG: hypothetical protein KatS3mg088_302 [Patescibacteria group bacterium]|nr:MAG: hypothetical protein KatS3mg088_302 [Patescibacteria group bacterium]